MEISHQLSRITAIGRTTGTAMTPEEAEQPALGPQELRHALAISQAQLRINGAITRVFQHAIAAGGAKTRRSQLIGVQNIGLQPTQSTGLLAMEVARLSQRFRTEIDPDHLETQASEERRLMAAAATGHNHSPGRLRSVRMALE